MRYCFVFGCPRSGTTAVTRLLHSHQAVVIGMERYKHLLSTRRGRARFGPALFERERFFDFREGDTNISPDTGQFTDHYAKARRRFDNGIVKYIGDKVMPDRPVIKAIEARLPSPKFIFIYRDLLPVASSYVDRASNPDDSRWPSADDHEAALARWHGAFASAEALIDRVGWERVCIVRYERLFNGEIETRDLLFHFLDLRITKGVGRHFESRTERWDEHRSKSLVLSPTQTKFLMRRMDKAVLDRFDRHFEGQLAGHVNDRPS